MRSATFTNMASPDGIPSDLSIEFYSALAKGGTGLIVTGMTAIDQVGRFSKGQLCLFDDAQIAGHKKMTDAIHEYSGVRIAPQLNHAGRAGMNPKFQALAPSSSPNPFTRKMAKEATTEDLKDVVKSFGSAARRAYESGYDMIQLHGGHGFLLSNFLSPHLNKRTDEYGGDIENRSRIIVEIYNEIRDQVGKDYPVLIKLNIDDYWEGGLNFEDGKSVVKILIDAGIDAIEPTGGGPDTMMNPKGRTYPTAKISSPEEENFFLPKVKDLKPLMKETPLIIMGGIRNPEFAEKLLIDGTGDFIALSRPLIYEPDLPNRWKSGDPSPALCVSCNKCGTTTMSGTIHCVTKKKAEKRRKRLEAQGK
jgi:2,4-dienoyl-CoA reductase-like NADH-dependent reductase (Old Yellow Enzyme family)